MSHAKVLKKLRKEMRRDIEKKYADFYDYAKGMNFWQRLSICWQVMFGKKR
jgi:hypothetical protein